MNNYIKVLYEYIEKEINLNDNFTLIKFENFNTPEIYLGICEYFENKMKNENIKFIAKLSREKYLQWTKSVEFKEVLDIMVKKSYVELEDSLTKWRNESFLQNKTNTCIFLLGAEAVEDKGGLEEFFKVSPEYLEKRVGTNYQVIYKYLEYNFQDNEIEIINKLIENIFLKVPKDLIKLSNRFEKIGKVNDYIDFIEAFCSKLYEDWGICNIQGLNQNEIKRIDKMIDEAYKFSKRIAFEYNSDKKMERVGNTLRQAYKDRKDEINEDIDSLIQGYDSYENFTKDLEKYLMGIGLDEVKDKILQTNYKFIASILKIKTKKDPVIQDKKNLISGNPFKALFLPILLEYGKLEAKSELKKISLEISEIKLAGTKDKDLTELQNKWQNLIMFLGGIENLVNSGDFVNEDGEPIEIDIYSQVDDKFIYPFDRKNITLLAKKGILCSGDNNRTKSTISITYKFLLERDEIERDYEWQFEDADCWCNLFSILKEEQFIEGLKSSEFLPIFIDKNVNELVDCKNVKELIYLIKNKKYDVKNIFNILEKNDLNSRIYNLGKAFTTTMNFINQKGLFAALDTNVMIPELFKSYEEMCIWAKEELKKNEGIQNIVNILSKAFLYLNDKNIKEKEIKGAVVPPIHPVMFERLVDQYRYLSKGFFELFNEIKEEFNDNCNSKSVRALIEKRFNRFIQLSEVTNSVEFLLSEKGYIEAKNNLGYYSIFGEKLEDYCKSNMNIDFSLNESENYKLGIGTPNSENITKIVNDYINTYPSKVDGIKIAFFEPKKYKEIILGINSLIKLKKFKDVELKINLIIYTSDYRCIESKYFKFWIDDNFDEDSNVKITPKMKYLSSTMMKKSLEDEIENTDIVFINDIMTYKNITSKEFEKNEFEEIGMSKYPLVYIPIETGGENTRQVLTSQPQFKCSDDFSQMMVYVNSGIVKDNNYNTVKTVELTEEKKKILGSINKKANWLVILDENIDKEVISQIGDNIIAFATGKGYFGELNLTISTNMNYAEDLNRFLERRLKKKFDWNPEEIRKAAKFCISDIKELDGAQIIKAINPSDQSINEYLAFCLTNKLLDLKKGETSTTIKKLISCDSYHHIFDEKINITLNDSSRPDFIFLEVDDIDSEELIIKIKVIECKTAKLNYDHIDKAIEQVTKGIKRIKEIWDVDMNRSIQNRYWYNQLYRILAYNNSNKNTDLFRKLQKINIGNFKIEISGEIFAYWINSDSEMSIQTKELKKDIDDEDYKIIQHELNAKYIKSILINNTIEESFVEDEISKPIIDIQAEDIIQEETGILINGEVKEVAVTKEYEIVKDEEQKENINVSLDSKKHEMELIEVFKSSEKNDGKEEETEKIKEKIDKLKKEFRLRNIIIIPDGYTIGPDIYRLYIKLGSGVELKQITKCSEDMKLWLSINEKPNIFIEDGRVNIDIPREQREVVRFKDAIIDTLNQETTLLENREEKLYVLLGVDIVGNSKVIDLSDSNNPHLLVAGQTGSGKSVLLASMLTSMMVYYKPEELEFWLVDPKLVELTVFEESPFTTKSVTEADEVENMLKELTKIMKERYGLFRKNRVKNIAEYNKKVSSEDRLKRIVGVIDEYGVLMESGKEFVKNFESELKQLSQLARAAGIHLIICTQSPKAEILTTTIRNNLPARVGLKVADGIASKLILDSSGAENLLGKGDMYIKTAETSNFIRCKSPYIDGEEIENLNKLWESRGYKINE